VLELRPTCQNCAKPLPPDWTLARICSFECTLCTDCVENVLDRVCPNCGANFAPRPIRPARNWRGNNYLGCYPATKLEQHRTVDLEAHRRLVAEVAALPPEQR
jgi:uncharacterized protein